MPVRKRKATPFLGINPDDENPAATMRELYISK
jgi:hypothetical protein